MDFSVFIKAIEFFGFYVKRITPLMNKKWALKYSLALLILFALSEISFANEDSSLQQSSFSDRFRFKNATVLAQLGVFDSVYQGNTQQINITGLIGDQFIPTTQNAQNLLLGLGYYVDGVQKNNFRVLYGLNAFYLAPTWAEGTMLQENIAADLSYSYSVSNYPIYLMAKSYTSSRNGKYDLSLDVGIGPNIINTSNFHENSLGHGSIPDNLFSGNTTAALSLTAGVGIKFNHVLAKLPLEIGYRFFYLGQGNLNISNPLVLNRLNTGNTLANALVLSTSF